VEIFEMPEFFGSRVTLVTATALVGLAALLSTGTGCRTERPSGGTVGRRGAILDRVGRVLAEDGIGARIFVDGGQARDLEVTADRLCLALGGCDAPTRARLTDPASHAPRFRVARRLASDAEVAAARGLGLRGVHVRPRRVRRYPYGDVGAGIIGHIDIDEWPVGLSGVEAAQGRLLRPQSGRDGAAIRLALDIELQGRLEAKLATLADRTSAVSISGVVMVAATGDILSVPQWPLTRRGPTLADFARFRPRFVSDVVEVGAFAAPIFAALARREGTFGEGDARQLGGSPQAVGERIVRARGPEWARQALANAGFGVPPGSRLQAETRGWVTYLESVPERRGERVGRGETTAASLLQLAAAYGGLVNGGRPVRPRLVLDDRQDGYLGQVRNDTSAANPDAPTVTVDPVLRAWAPTAADVVVPELIFVRTEHLRRFDAKGLTSVVVLAAAGGPGEARVLALHVEAPLAARPVRRHVQAAGVDILAEALR
jgi:cell division protein FtsI/penicillin-binding protein 2